MGDPRLGWWVQLVECSAFDKGVRTAVMGSWGLELFGSAVCEIDWPEGNPAPNMLMMYGTAEDVPPNFDEMAEHVRMVMDDDQYFAFIFMKDVLLAKGGLECVAISKNAVVRINGRLMIDRIVSSALSIESSWRAETTGE